MFIDTWIPNLGLFLADKATLQTSQWLNDNIIHAAQQLLKRTFAGMEGLKSPQLGNNLTFKHISTRSRYLQVLHINGNHWICVSNIGLYSQEPVTDRTFIYDSFVPDNIECQTKLQICSFVRPSSSSFRFEMMNIMVQQNTFDCGLFAIANMTEVAYGGHPGRCVWDTNKLREHLIACLEEQYLVPFPKLKERRVPFSGAVKHSVKEDIHCVCRMPYDNVSKMIRCSSCHIWFHCDCINMEDVTQYSRKKWTCRKCLDMFH